MAKEVLALLLVLTACSPAPPERADPGPSPPAVDRSGDTGPIRVGTVWFDRTEVTIADVTRYAEATSTRTAAERDGGGFEYVGGWQRRTGWTFRRPEGADARTDLPAVHLSWQEANDYCAWAGGRLPTAAEWRDAAYTERRETPPAPLRRGSTYPYPTGASAERANTRGDGDGFATAAPVGSFPPGVNGLYDTAANAWEWLADGRADERLIAGGSWWYGPEQTGADAFQYKAASFYAVYVGVRCAYDRRPG